MEPETLEELGMTHSEAKLYLTLLQTGLTTTGKLIADSHVSRSKVYDVLERLKHKGFVSEVYKRNARHFEATDPSRILDFLEQKQATLAKTIIRSRTTVKQLKSLQNRLREKQEARVYTGIEGWKAVYADLLSSASSRDEYLAFGIGAQELRNAAIVRFIRSFHLKRAEQGIPARVLVHDTARKGMNKFQQLQLYEYRFTTEKFPTNIAILGDVVVTLVWGNLPVAYLIHSKQVAAKYREYFESIWGIGTSR